MIRGIVCFCVELLTASGLIGNFREVLKVEVKFSCLRHEGTQGEKRDHSTHS